jgi:hypothetical protein
MSGKNVSMEVPFVFLSHEAEKPSVGIMGVTLMSILMLVDHIRYALLVLSNLCIVSALGFTS